MSTFVDSPLKIELIGTGEQAGLWGATTNVNWKAIQAAITGSVDVTFSGSDVTLTLTNTNTAQDGRYFRLYLTGTSGGDRNLLLGSGAQIEKFYLIENALDDTVTIKNDNGSDSGVAIASGAKYLVYNDGTNVEKVVAVNLTSDVSGVLPAANGGTGISSLGSGVATWLGTPSSANLAAAVTGETGTGALVFANTPTLVTPILGTPTSGNLDNCTGSPTLTAPDLGTPSAGNLENCTIPLAGISDLAGNLDDFLQTPSSANLAAAVTDETGSGALVFGTSPTLTTPAINQSTIKTTKEAVTVSATAASSTVNFDAITQSVLYYTTNASGNWTLNVRGDGSTTLNSIMSIGQSITVAFLATQGATAYYQSAFQVDGSSVTPKWQGGAAPTFGNTSGIDSYIVTIIKTADATFTALAAQTQFA